MKIEVCFIIVCIRKNFQTPPRPSLYDLRLTRERGGGGNPAPKAVAGAEIVHAVLGNFDKVSAL